ncbi:MAG: hypothetical protein ACJARZ_001975 [Dokdonia sp.]|jgi:hypothetical protein
MPTIKYKLLIIGLLMDAAGVLTSSWVIPAIGDFADIAWAPFAAWLMTRMYKGTAGKIAGLVTFVEEITPYADIVPSFTLMWLYTFMFKGETPGEIIERKGE